MPEVKLVEKKKELTSKLTHYKDVKVGEIAICNDIGDIKFNNGTIVLRTYVGWVDLNQPNKTWGSSDGFPAEYFIILKNLVITIEHEVD